MQWVKILEFIICFIEVLYMDIFFSLILKRRQSIPKYMYIVLDIIVATVLFITANNMKSSSIVAFVLTIVYAIALHSNKVTNKIFYGVIFVLAISICDIITVNSISLMLGLTVNEVIVFSSSYRFIANCISRLILFIFLKIIVRFGNQSDTNMDNKHIYEILSIYIILIGNMLLLLKLNIMNNSRMSSMIISIVVTGLLVSSIIIYITFQNICKYYREIKTNEIIELKNKFLQEHSISKENSDKEIRKMWHDMNNHIITISSFAHNGDNNRIVEYVNEIQEYMEEVPMTISTGNKIANAVINQKKVIAKNSRIKYEVYALIPECINISDMDLCAFLSNAIDNALEASIKIKDENKRGISIKIERYKDYLFINIINSIDKNHNINRLATSKKDKKNHGFGIVSMESIVNKYDGNIQYEVRDNTFNLKAFLLIE